MCECDRRVTTSVETCEKKKDCESEIVGGSVAGGILGLLVAGPVGGLIGAGLGGMASASTCENK